MRARPPPPPPPPGVGGGAEGLPSLCEQGHGWTPGLGLPRPRALPGLLRRWTDWELCRTFLTDADAVTPVAGTGRVPGRAQEMGLLFSPPNCLGGPGQGKGVRRWGGRQEGRAGPFLMVANCRRGGKGEVPPVCPSPPHTLGWGLRSPLGKVPSGHQSPCKLQQSGCLPGAPRRKLGEWLGVGG